MGHTSDIHCVGPGGAGSGYDDDDDVLIQLPDVAREAEKEEKKNSSHATHRQQGASRNLKVKSQTEESFPLDRSVAKFTPLPVSCVSVGCDAGFGESGCKFAFSCPM